MRDQLWYHDTFIFIKAWDKSKSREDIYGIDIMQDNVDLCIKRLGGGNIYCDDSLNPKTPQVKFLFNNQNTLYNV